MFKKIWNFFTSLKLTIYLGLIFILVTIIGSFYIQNNPDFFTEIDMQNFFKWFINASSLDFKKVLWIWAILLILFLLAINTFVCSIEKIISIAHLLGNPSVEITPDFIDNLRVKNSFTLDKDSGFKQKISKILENKNYRTIIKETSNGDVIIYGDKGGWSKFAPYIVHLAFILVLIGHFISSLTGSKINGIPIFYRQSINLHGTNITARFNEIKFDYLEDNKSIKNFEANISIFEDGRETLTKYAKINHPIFFRDNMVLYILTYGFYQERFLYILINVNQDKGAKTVFIASLLMLAGLYCTLFITYRRFWIYISPSIDGSEKYQIKIGGWADNINFELEKRVNEFIKEIQNTTDIVLSAHQL